MQNYIQVLEKVVNNQNIKLGEISIEKFSLDIVLL